MIVRTDIQDMIVKSEVTGFVHPIRDSINCETQNCIYYWKCLKNNFKEYPKCEYIWRTTRAFRISLGKHKQYIRSRLLTNRVEIISINKDTTYLKSMDPFVLKARESYLIQKFDTYNKESWVKYIGRNSPSWNIDYIFVLFSSL